MKRLLPVLLTLCAAAGCGAEVPVTGTVTVALAPATESDGARAASILVNRLSEYLSSRSMRIVATSSGTKEIVLTFHGAPDYPEDLVRYFVLSRGQLRVFPANEPTQVWVTEADVLEARSFRASRGAETSYMQLRLRKELEEQLLVKSRAIVGRELVVTMDGEVVSRAFVGGAFGREFQFDSPGNGKSLMIAILLRYGALPVSVQSYKYQPSKSER